jgi:glutamate/tyrosine decarboxylase-like PLP-dependent enzyme
MILPATAHPCFHKAAQYLDIKTVMIDVDPQTYRADVDAMEAAITDQTILLVGSATSYAHGVVDPIAELGQVALKHGLLLHVDGCIGGFMLPLFRELGAEITPFDFSVPGVTSISMDLHKYAFAPKGASTVLYRNDSIRQYQIFTWSDWPGYSIINPTIQSSKSGGPLAATWALMNHMGMEGYLKEAAKLKGGMETIVSGVEKIDGLRVLGKPEMSLIAIACEGFSVFGLCEEMKKLGWNMHPQMKMGDLVENFHLTVMPSNVPHLDSWVEDLAKTTARMRGAAADVAPTPIKAMLASVDLSKVSDGQLGELMAMAGLGNGDLPDQDMTEINEILNELPSDIRDRLLTIYFNKLSRYKGE